MYIKLLVITATLILLAAFTSKSHAGVEGTIDTETADITFQNPSRLSHKLIEVPGLTSGTVERGVLVASGTITSSDATALSIRWDRRYIGVGTNPYWGNVGLDGKMEDWLFLTIETHQPTENTRDDKWIATNTFHKELTYSLKTRERKSIKPGTYTAVLEASVWQL
ncbi:hypothetical protein ACLD9R_15185 [Serratia marcescens]|uniref:hypothetical protein n=1 Tax=Serratia marcescens TaxID=615 RepID=UPI00396CC715